MAVITLSAALLILPLDDMKLELRIDSAITEHDDLISKQIQSAVSYVSRTTGAEGDNLLPLRLAVAAVVRDLYDGYREIRPNAASDALMQPYKSYGAG